MEDFFNQTDFHDSSYGPFPNTLHCAPFQTDNHIGGRSNPYDGLHDDGFIDPPNSARNDPIGPGTFPNTAGFGGLEDENIDMFHCRDYPKFRTQTPLKRGHKRRRHGEILQPTIQVPSLYPNMFEQEFIPPATDSNQWAQMPEQEFIPPTIDSNQWTQMLEQEFIPPATDSSRWTMMPQMRFIPTPPAQSQYTQMPEAPRKEPFSASGFRFPDVVPTPIPRTKISYETLNNNATPLPAHPVVSTPIPQTKISYETLNSNATTLPTRPEAVELVQSITDSLINPMSGLHDRIVATRDEVVQCRLEVARLHADFEGLRKNFSRLGKKLGA